MFEGIADAVHAHRTAGVEHRRARDRGDHAGMRVQAERLRVVAGYLRGQRCPELIHPLTMEWVTRGRDAQACARFAAEVDRLVAAVPARPERTGPAQVVGSEQGDSGQGDSGQGHSGQGHSGQGHDAREAEQQHEQ